MKGAEKKTLIFEEIKTSIIVQVIGGGRKGGPKTAKPHRNMPKNRKPHRVFSRIPKPHRETWDRNKALSGVGYHDRLLVW